MCYNVAVYNTGATMTTSRSTLHMKLDATTKDVLADFAAMDNRSLANLIETILLDYVGQRIAGEEGGDHSEQLEH